MNLVEHIHGHYVLARRARVLSQQLAALVPVGSRVLDVGCGDGLIADLIMRDRPDVDVIGIDPLVRDQTYIPVERFDGQVIPYGDAGFDVVMFVDVLHHTEDPTILLREAARVARKSVLIKDHLCDGLVAHSTLRYMDWVGNARYGVPLPHNYWPERRWLETLERLGLKPRIWRKDLPLYPWPMSWLFGRSLHFISSLDLN